MQLQHFIGRKKSLLHSSDLTNIYVQSDVTLLPNRETKFCPAFLRSIYLVLCTDSGFASLEA